jgi:tetratricopeptide (TPR) repeat protein
MAVDDRPPATTDGEIAAINLESARRRAWARLAEDPLRPGVAEEIVDDERLVAQFLGDLDALDRTAQLASQLESLEDSPRAALILAEVASMAHRFADARRHLVHAAQIGAAHDECERQALAIDQACGVGLDAVLAARCRIAAASGRAEDLVPLAALLVDLERFAEAVTVYRQARSWYDGVSPFLPAWVCFQLGMLWGESMPVPEPSVAAVWYRRAVAYLPGYVKARVHWAEICIGQGRPGDALAILLPVLASPDPEVSWRLADALLAQGRSAEAETHLDAARRRFDRLLERQPLAFADHAAEFYAGSGGDCGRALELARANVANRPTRRAIEQLQALERRESPIDSVAVFARSSR